mmetsp:Transcript_6161/g.11855  ORF Transcript_6161/g.11855 Transcript_6161/m.11855 type:complete len:238 (+) Transcript_6161:623-1336(+)
MASSKRAAMQRTKPVAKPRKQTAVFDLSCLDNLIASVYRSASSLTNSLSATSALGPARPGPSRFSCAARRLSKVAHSAAVAACTSAKRCLSSRIDREPSSPNRASPSCRSTSWRNVSLHTRSSRAASSHCCSAAWRNSLRKSTMNCGMPPLPAKTSLACLAIASTSAPKVSEGLTSVSAVPARSMGPNTGVRHCLRKRSSASKCSGITSASGSHRSRIGWKPSRRYRPARVSVKAPT